MTRGRSDTLDDALVPVLGKFSTTLEARRSALLDGTDKDYGHAVRVAARRARVVLQLAAPALRKGLHAQGIMADLKLLAGAIGRVRDLTLARKSLPPLLDDAQAALFMPALKQVRARALVQCRTLLASPRMRRMEQRLARLSANAVEDLGTVRLTPLAARRAGTLLRKATVAGRALTVTCPSESVHDLRKLLKKLRYSMELLSSQSALPWHAATLARLKTAQDSFGHYQDLSVQIEMLDLLAGADLPTNAKLPDSTALTARCSALRDQSLPALLDDLAGLLDLCAGLGVVDILDDLARKPAR